MSDEFRLKDDQKKKAVAYIHWLIGFGVNPRLEVRGIDQHGDGCCVYVGKPGTPEAWRFHIEAMGPGQVKR